MKEKLKRNIATLWHKIKTLDYEHLGIHISSYTRLFIGTAGIVWFGFMIFMGLVYWPVLAVQIKTAPGITSNNNIGALFRVWPMFSFLNALALSLGGLAWSLYQFTKSLSCYDYHYRRVVELRSVINDATENMEENGKGTEWLKDLNFEDSNEAREVANFVFLGKKLGLNAKRLVENEFKE